MPPVHSKGRINRRQVSCTLEMTFLRNVMILRNCYWREPKRRDLLRAHGDLKQRSGISVHSSFGYTARDIDWTVEQLGSTARTK